MCETTGFCSFPDSTCPGGRKYEDNAGNGLAGTCVVGDAGIDASTSGSCIRAVSHGRHFGCVLKTDGTVWCVGANERGQIGFGLQGAQNVVTWMQARDGITSVPIADATAIGAGWEHVCVVRAGGSVWCWGRSNFGQVGHNMTVDTPAAARVLKETDNMPLLDVVEVGGGLDHTCARDTASAVWCWGRNQHNQLGDNTVLQRNRAVQVMTGATSLVVGRDTNCARKADNETWCWGRNNDGQVGDGTSVNKPVPTMVGLAKEIEIGSFVICRIMMDDTVACSGQPWRGRLGNGARNDDPDVVTPAVVLTAPTSAPLANVTEIALGGASCARLANGTVQCWSDNTHGQSGTGMSSPYPAAVRTKAGTPLDNVEKISAGFSHLCAKRTNGEYYCWGRGLNGEFGDGKLEDRGLAAPLEFPCE